MPRAPYDALAPVCLTRLERALLQLTATPLGPGGYFLVTGGSEPHAVNLTDPTLPACDCGDHTFRDTNCAHILAARLHVHDPAALQAIPELVATMRARIAALERNARRLQIRLTPRLKAAVATALNRAHEEIHFEKGPLTGPPVVTVLGAVAGQPTGAILGTIRLRAGIPRFEAETAVTPTLSQHQALEPAPASDDAPQHRLAAAA